MVRDYSITFQPKLYIFFAFSTNMAARATSALVKRTSFSTALNVLPNEIAELDHDVLNNDLIETIPPKPYSSIPGPKELPIIGNSWRFAPIIGKEFILNISSERL